MEETIEVNKEKYDFLVTLLGTLMVLVKHNKIDKAKELVDKVEKFMEKEVTNVEGDSQTTGLEDNSN